MSWKEAIRKYKENGSIPFVFFEEELLAGSYYFRYENVSVKYGKKSEKMLLWGIVALCFIFALSIGDGNRSELISIFSLIVICSMIYYFMKKFHYIYFIDRSKKLFPKKIVYLSWNEKKVDEIIHRIRREFFTRGYSLTIEKL